MLTQPDIDELVFQFLIQNHFHFKQVTVKFKEQKEALLAKEDPCFHEEIKEQYRELVKQMIRDEFTKQFAVPVDNVMITLEGLNVDAYV